MNQFVTIIGKQALTTSLIVAEAFGKQHRNVLQSIEKLECSKVFTELNFQLSEYRDSTGRSLPMYNITRDGFAFLAFGFTGKKAAEFKEKFILAFNQMEEFLLEKTGKRVDVNMNHARLGSNPHGLDIRFTFDLTKIAQRPTRAGFAFVERLTGVCMDDILPESPESADKSRLFTDFYAAHCSKVNTHERLLFAGVYTAFLKWAAVAGLPTIAIPSRRSFSHMMQQRGHDVLRSGGNSYIINLILGEGN